MKTLVTGGVRSGKSVVAERLLADEPRVQYVATGRPADPSDGEWMTRVVAHQQRRPGHWSTLESRDVVAVFEHAESAVLVDCLGTWLTGVLDDLDAWNREDWLPELRVRVDAMVAALAECSRRVVLVSNEVGWGLVSEHRSGRIFADQLGLLNQQVAAVCDDVQLVVAGRVITL